MNIISIINRYNPWVLRIELKHAVAERDRLRKDVLRQGGEIAELKRICNQFAEENDGLKNTLAECHQSVVKENERLKENEIRLVDDREEAWKRLEEEVNVRVFLPNP